MVHYILYGHRFVFTLQEFGDSARARKLYEQDSDDDDDEELEPNPKLEQGKYPLHPNTFQKAPPQEHEKFLNGPERPKKTKRS